MIPSFPLPAESLQLPPAFSNSTAEEYLETLTAFVDKYEWLIELYVIDFITHNKWSLLDPEWQQALLPDDLGNEEDWFNRIIDLAAKDHPSYDESWPASLKEYLHQTRQLALPRSAFSLDSVVKTKIEKHVLPGMSEKKIHEVELMSTLIKSVANDRGVNSAVDLGSGQGYLSRALAFQHDMQVLAVDMSEIQTRGAEKFDKTAYKGFARQHDEHAESPRLHHVTEKITPDNISDVLNRWGTNTDPNEQWLVCGLHACGDLSSMILRLFAESSEVSCMVNVGCCYHNLTCEDDEIETDDAAPIYGFPMSQALAGYKMGTTARVLACQSPWRWAEQKKGSHVSFLHHFYRALLQKMFVEKGLSTVSTPPVLGRMHKRKGFTDYIQTALRRLDMPAETISEEESNEYLEEYVSKRVDKQLVVLWMLRVLLAPVLESIVLVDRYLYLKEAIASSTNPQKGVWMFPLFDLSASPRNVVFIASK